MSKKSLNHRNLVALGPETLAELLLEVVKGRAALQRRVRLALSAHQGAEEVALDLRRRFASLRQAQGRVPRKTEPTLARELAGFLPVIEAQVAAEAPALAAELLWELLGLAPGLFARCEDGRGTIQAALAEAVPALARVIARVQAQPGAPDPGPLAEAVFEAVLADRHALFEPGLGALLEALGPEGRAQLAALAEAASAPPATPAPPQPPGLRGRADQTQRNKAAAWAAAQDRARRARTLQLALARLTGDIDALIALHPPEARSRPEIAAPLARALLEAGRAPEALAMAEAASGPAMPVELETVLQDALAATGQKGALRDRLWAAFTTRLDAASLRRHLGLLPDFDDIDAEDAAMRLVAGHPDSARALRFLLDWPDLGRAAALVQQRGAELAERAGTPEGEALLQEAAEALAASFPLAAVALWRALVIDVLAHGPARRQAMAAEALRACLAADAQILDYRDAPDHLAFLARLRRNYPRAIGFWARLEA